MNVIENDLKENGFDLIGTIGEGGFAKVFTVHWRQYPNQIFAAKVININDENDTSRMNSCVHEITSLMRLSHPGIIYYFKNFQVGQHFYIILEFCPNGSLYQKVKKNGPLSQDEFVDVAKQCLEALKACHQKGIAHYDIKPENILISEHKKIKLSDFGLADFINTDDDKQLTTHKGSMPYLAPEQFTPNPFDPQRSDVWSLGVTFYFLITGNHPWICKTKEEMINNLFNSEVYFPSNINNQIVKLITSMMVKNPRYRALPEELLKNPIFATIPKIPEFRSIPKKQQLLAGISLTIPAQRRKSEIPLQGITSFRNTNHRNLITLPESFITTT